MEFLEITHHCVDPDDRDEEGCYCIQNGNPKCLVTKNKGVYMFCAFKAGIPGNTPIYIGKACNMRTRLSQYLNAQPSQMKDFDRYCMFADYVHDVLNKLLSIYIIYETPKLKYQLIELNLVTHFKPYFNKVGVSRL